MFTEEYKYLDSQDYETNFQRWWSMAADDRRKAMIHGFDDKPLDSEDEARSIFNKLYGYKYTNPVRDPRAQRAVSF